MLENGENTTRFAWSRSRPSSKEEVTLKPEEAILYWSAENTFRLTPKQSYSIKDIIAVKHEDVLMAIEYFFNNDSTIVNGIKRIGCTNVSVWTVLFSSEAFAKAKKLIDKTIQIITDSSEFEFQIEDASVEKQVTKSFVFRFQNLPAHFNDFNAIKEILRNNKFIESEIDSIYREKLRDKKGKLLNIEKAEIRVRIKVNPTDENMVKINALSHKAILQLPNGQMLHDLPITITRIGSRTCNHCGSCQHTKASCSDAQGGVACLLCKSLKHSKYNCPRYVDGYYRPKIIHDYMPEDFNYHENNDTTSNGKGGVPKSFNQKDAAINKQIVAAAPKTLTLVETPKENIDLAKSDDVASPAAGVIENNQDNVQLNLTELLNNNVNSFYLGGVANPKSVDHLTALVNFASETDWFENATGESEVISKATTPAHKITESKKRVRKSASPNASASSDCLDLQQPKKGNQGQMGGMEDIFPNSSPNNIPLIGSSFEMSFGDFDKSVSSFLEEKRTSLPSTKNQKKTDSTLEMKKSNIPIKSNSTMHLNKTVSNEINQSSNHNLQTGSTTNKL